MIKENSEMPEDTSARYPIIPKPVQLIPAKGVFRIQLSTIIRVSPDAYAIGKFLQGLLPFNLSVKKTRRDKVQPGGILLTTKGADPAWGLEGYHLTVSPESIVVRACLPSGLFYGLQTLRQLISPVGDEIPAVEIIDWPRFSWRGIMLDVGRHLFPVDFIKRLIDAMALHKLNVLHWHLTEDQGWRIEIKGYPKLTKIGSRRSASPIPSSRKELDGKTYQGYYSQIQVKKIVAYAARQFITIVPEVEMPGHSVAALAAYPELGCTGGPYRVRNKWGIAKDVFCAGNEQVYAFLQNVLDEILALFPSKYIHIGGDECPKTRWEQCPKCQATIQKQGLKDEHELQSYFIQRIEEYLNSHDRRLIGWDEILEGGLAPNASVMSWRGVDGGIVAARQGHDVVMTPTSHCYFDYYQSAEKDNEPDAIGGFVPLERVYSFDPVPIQCSAEEAQHILGAQGNLWTEYISTSEMAGYMLFPRASALAEVVWSTSSARDYGDFIHRLGKFLPILHKMGIDFRPL
jgi:hexosaminidase